MKGKSELSSARDGQAGASRPLVDLLEECDRCIVAGNIQAAVKLLSKLNIARIPRRYRLALAKISRRAGRLDLGLRLLTPLFRAQQGGLRTPAQPGELAEYAVLLQRSGAVHEAMAILRSPQLASTAETPLFLSYCHFNLWQYEEAIPYLEEYLKTETTPYMKLVGQVNLCAALLSSGRMERAISELHAALEISRTAKAQRLQANCLEMLAQAHIHFGKLNKAESTISEAAHLLGVSQTHDELFVQKWRAVITALRFKSTQPLDEFRKNALLRREFEGVREADLYSLMIHFEQNSFDRLYFGTPFISYRKRICELLNRRPSENEFLLGAKGSPCFDLATGSIDGKASVSQGSKTHLLFCALMTDLYRPKRVGELFAALFPDEYFNVFTSPNRVKQVVYRTRQWIAGAKWPLAIAVEDGLHSLSMTGHFSFRLRGESHVRNRYDLMLDQLSEKFACNVEFSMVQAQATLGVSSATCKRIASYALGLGKLEKFGASQNTVYFFPDVASGLAPNIVSKSRNILGTI